MKIKLLFAVIVLMIASIGCKKETNDDPNGNGNNNSVDQLSVLTSNVVPSDSTATINGYIHQTGSTVVDSRGFCLSLSANPNLTNSIVTTDGNGTGSFSHVFDNLLPQTTYHVRAYGTNSSGTYYGDDISFQLSNKIPTVSTSSATGITQIIAYGGGDVTSDGGSPVTERGVLIGKQPNLTYVGPGPNVIQSGSGTGSFNVTFDSLWADTTYYIRAYAVNSIGVGYGAELSFHTLASPYTIGQTYQGGVIFFIDQTGLHGYICATVDQGTNFYAPAGTGFLNATGSGQYNTNLLVNLFGASAYAAGMCNSLTLNGYSDWFLPSIGELLTVYEQRNLIGGFNGPDFIYWSSTDNFLYAPDASAVNFVTGSSIVAPKNSSHKVRAVRKF